MIEIRVTCERCGYTEGRDFEKWNSMSRMMAEHFTIGEYQIVPIDYSLMSEATRMLCLDCYDGYKRIVETCNNQKEQLVTDFFETDDEPDGNFITEEDFKDI